jgi:hypothetical protein
MERVQEIVDLMSRLQWHPRKTQRLADKWGVSKSRVQDLAAEASRIVRSSIDREEVRMRFFRALEQIASDARSAKRTFVDAKGVEHRVPFPDWHAATKALMGAAELIGLKTAESNNGVTPVTVTIQTYPHEGTVQTESTTTGGPDPAPEPPAK